MNNAHNSLISMYEITSDIKINQSFIQQLQPHDVSHLNHLDFGGTSELFGSREHVYCIWVEEAHLKHLGSVGTSEPSESPEPLGSCEHI